jgi:formate dehydrogenase subunit gamma
LLIDLADDKRAKDVCNMHGNQPDAALEILHDIQAAEGFLSDHALRTVADMLNISRAEIHGLVSFYHDYRREPPPAHRIKLCRAEACQAVGSEALAAHVEAKLGGVKGAVTAIGGIGFEASYCLGNCALGPAALIDGVLHARLDADKIDEIVAAMKAVQ